MVGLDARLLNAIGGRSAKPLEDHLGLRTVGDLLGHYPYRYARRGQLTDLRDLRVGEHVTVLAEVSKVTSRPMKSRPGYVVEAEVTDGTGELTLTFFAARERQRAWRCAELRKGRRGLFAGEVGEFNETRQLIHPDYQLVPAGETQAAESYADVLLAIYPATKKLSSWKIAASVAMALAVLDEPPDPLPVALREREGLVGLGEALRGIHQPRDDAQWRRARKRLTWDEAFVLQATLAQRRLAAAATPAVPRQPVADGLLTAFDATLPFVLTAGQREVGELIAAELAGSHPMHRLLHGEVGSGKTVVALRAMLAVVDAGGQAALLAPTEVLAGQHARSLAQLLGPLAEAGRLGGAERATRIALLTGSLGAAARRASLTEVASGAAGLVVGTHALLEPDVAFRDLGLVVVDEQHRFGVEQRDALRAKGSSPPHVLVMTATPIPRTVAMTVYGDLELSALAELPAGRQPVRTFVVPAAEPKMMVRLWGRVRDEVTAGRQAYVVCPRIGGEDEQDDVAATSPWVADEPAREAVRPMAAVVDVAPLLADGELRGLRLGVLHGRLPAEEKDAVMGDFAAGRLDVLVATTVVEVGVDVSNATVMVVLDAERFGMSQLHQLRGRVGRGSVGGWCLLHTAAPLGSSARDRLRAVAATTDGFVLARLDLEQRREGDVLGAAQHGRRSQLKLLRLLRDEALIAQARAEATALVTGDPSLAAHPALAGAIASTLDAERAEYLDKT